MGDVSRLGVGGGPVRLALLGAAAVIALGACSSGARSPSAGSSSSSSAQPSPSTPAGVAPSSGDKPVVADTGIKLAGAFDTKPTRQLVEQTVVAGKGTPIASGDTVITNYVSEIWPARNGAQAKVFDSSFPGALRPGS